MGDFNSDPSEIEIYEFCSLYNLKNLVHDPTCYKNYINPTCIDLMLTNRMTYFQNTRTIETGLSDFHKMTVTVMKTSFKKHPAKVISYGDYKGLSNTLFNEEFEYMLFERNFYSASNDNFVDMTMNIVNRMASVIQKFIRTNNSNFMTKGLRQAMMHRSKLKNKFYKLKTESAHDEYRKQRNLCTYLLKKAKKEYYSKLNPKNITDNKRFWHTVKPIFLIYA